MQKRQQRRHNNDATWIWAMVFALLACTGIAFGVGRGMSSNKHDSYVCPNPDIVAIGIQQGAYPDEGTLKFAEVCGWNIPGITDEQR